MKSVVSFIFLLLISVTLGQITFTREWVKGKRSPTASAAMKEEHSACRSLISAVEYLIELERMRLAECSECCRTTSPNLPIIPDLQRSPSDFMTFLREIPPLEQVPQERLVSPTGDRRNQ